MENKVIVDDVDVSECKHLYSDEMCDSEQTLSCECGKNKGCEYKQLQRLEAENEKLKQVTNESIIEQEKLVAKVNELEQENETLERTNNELRKRFSEDTTKLSAELKELKADIESRTMCITCERELQNCNLQAENERLKEEINKLGKKHEDYCNTMYWQMKEQMDKYRQALQEIKEIAKNEVETRMLFSDEKSFCDFNDILTKINEVIGVELDE